MRIKLVKKISKGYLGMNRRAAKELGIDYPYSEETILINKSLSKKEQKKTIAHEKIELFHMKRGLKYREAHKIANALEANIK